MSSLILIDGKLCLCGSDDTKVYKVICTMRKQLNCDKGTDNWNLVMKLTLDQETRYNEFKRL